MDPYITFPMRFGGNRSKGGSDFTVPILFGGNRSKDGYNDEQDDDDEDQLKRNDDLEAINEETYKQIKDLQDEIYNLKKKLFASIVSGDILHNSSDMGAMMSFHAVFLQIVGYWIGLLDSSPVLAPRLKQDSPELTQFKTLTEKIKSLSKNHDARTLVYSLLCTLSTAHPGTLKPTI